MDNFQKLNGEASWTKPPASHSLWAECRKLLGIEGNHTMHISFVFPPEWRAGINILKRLLSGFASLGFDWGSLNESLLGFFRQRDERYGEGVRLWNQMVWHQNRHEPKTLFQLCSASQPATGSSHPRSCRSSCPRCPSGSQSQRLQGDKFV